VSRSLRLLLATGLLGMASLGSICLGPPASTRIELPGLAVPVRVSVDFLGVPHLEAQSDHDLFMTLGYLHARDRFFQMDWNRRRADGRLAAFSGDFTHLQGDLSTRLLGLRAAAQRSMDALEPGELALLAAYADGVNAWRASHPLPPEYAALEVSVVAPWTPLDTLLLGKGMFASIIGPRIWEIDESAILAEYVAVLGEERAALVYPDELQRFAPWLPFATVPDASGTPLAKLGPARLPRPATVAGARLARQLEARAAEDGFLAQALARPQAQWGSNAWGVAAAHSATGGPLVAGDPHLAGAAPSILYEAHLASSDPDAGPLNASGASVPGIPGILLGGQTDRIAWAVTAFTPDVSDVFRDRLVRGDPGCPARLCIRSAGVLHPVEERSERYLINVRGDGVQDNANDVTDFLPALVPASVAAIEVLRVPFRSFGPVLEVEDRSVLGGGPTETDVLTLQWSGLHADRAVRYVLDGMRARDVFAFENAVEWLTLGGLHHVVGDVDGNLAYYAGGEIPLRADLEAGAPLDGLPPWLIRDGSGPANWVPDPAHAQGQVLPFAVLPRSEMPSIVNPPAGFVVNCNEDSSGFALDNDLLNDFRPSKPAAIHYIGDLGSRGLRNARVTEMLREKANAGGLLTLDDMKRIQADTRPAHADLLVPHLLAAFDSALRPGAPAALASLAADPRVVEAVGRLRAWDFSHPTGIAEGYDASDVDGLLGPVSAAEAQASVAATLYEVWVIKLAKRFGATLQTLGLRTASPVNSLLHFLGEEPFTGVGPSGLNYFPEPAALVDANDRRDTMLLEVLRAALDALPGPAYAAAFANSTAQDDYRWGRLHRIVIPHLVNANASIPPAAGFQALGPQLPGLARDGTWESVNVAPGPGLPDGANEWLNTGGPLAQFRHVHALPSPGSGAGVSGFAALNGGASSDPASPLYASQLRAWLTVDYHPVAMSGSEIGSVAQRIELFAPPP
jgi:penicillin amidase